MIEIQNLSYAVSDATKHDTTTILSDVNICIPDHAITVITGQNGSGKSTLVKLIMGLLQPSAGDIIYQGENITNLPITARANLGLTLAFQQPVRFKGITVKDLIDIASKQENTIENACIYLSKVGLCAKDYLKREVDDTLSGGELKRIELAVALAKNGEVYLFDEPEAGIDLWSFEDLIQIFESLKDKTVIIVSHQKKILEIADQILVLSPNKQPMMGTKETMLPLLSGPRCDKLGGNV